MIDVARSVSIAGNATLMTDSSMLAMLDARIVAISTQGLAPAGPDTAADVDWIIASSQGLVLRDDIVAGVPPRSPGKTVIHHRRRAHSFPALLRTVFLKDNDAQPIVLPRKGRPLHSGAETPCPKTGQERPNEAIDIESALTSTPDRSLHRTN